MIKCHFQENSEIKCCTIIFYLKVDQQCHWMIFIISETSNVIIEGANITLKSEMKIIILSNLSLFSFHLFQIQKFQIQKI
jgi:hypothetical protein